MSYFKIQGVIPPMITPFKENGDVDYDKFVRNIERWNQAELTGYLVLGSNSETVYLTEEEKLKLIALTVKHRKKERVVLAGTGMESTRETIRLTNKAADLGVDAALIITPFYYGGKMNDEALINFFTEVADHCKIPILLYNVTKVTHISLLASAVEVLSKHPNIIGMKDSSGDMAQMVEFIRVRDKQFNLLAGTASAWYPALALGIEGGIMALANACPNECAQVQKYFNEGNINKARELYLKLYPVNKGVTTIFGVAGLKYSCELLGFDGGWTRKPLLNLTENEKSSMKEILKCAELI